MLWLKVYCSIAIAFIGVGKVRADERGKKEAISSLIPVAPAARAAVAPAAPSPAAPPRARPAAISGIAPAVQKLAAVSSLVPATPIEVPAPVVVAPKVERITPRALPPPPGPAPRVAEPASTSGVAPVVASAPPVSPSPPREPITKPALPPLLPEDQPSATPIAMPKLVSEVAIAKPGGGLPPAPAALSPSAPAEPASSSAGRPLPEKSDIASPPAEPKRSDAPKRVAVRVKDEGISLPPATTAQVAPVVPVADPSHGLAGDVGAELEDEVLAAEVAAILSPESAKRLPHPSTVPRAKVVRVASERWLLDACEEINALPEEERPREFQKVLALYKQMRIEERSARPR
jgi:hypothetical protein